MVDAQVKRDLLKKAEEYVRRGALGNAIRTYEKAGKHLSRDDIINIGDNYFKEGRYEYANDAYNRVKYNKGMKNVEERINEERKELHKNIINKIKSNILRRRNLPY